jgi:PEP-CTERM motif
MSRHFRFSRVVGRFGILSGALALVLFALPGVAMAVITADTDGSPVFKQTQDDPCIIGDPSCNQNGFIFTSRSGPASGGVYSLFTPVYDATTLTGVAAPSDIPSTFTIGIDENLATGAGPETLDFFRTFIATGCAEGTLAGAGDVNTAPAGCTLTLDPANSFETDTVIPNNNNGVGFTDMLLLGFNLNPANLYVFQMRWTGDTDGMEEVFIIPAGTPAVAEPGTLLLLGSGFVGLAALARKKLHR